MMPMRAVAFAVLFVGIALLAGSGTALSSIDPSAIDVSLEPHGSLDSVSVVIGMPGTDAAMVDLRHVTIGIRRIGDAQERDVPITGDSPTPQPWAPEYGGPSHYYALQLALPQLSPGPYQLVAHAEPGLVTSQAGSPFPIAEPAIGAASINIYLPTATAPPLAVGDTFIAISRDGRYIGIGDRWKLARIDSDADGCVDYTYSGRHSGVLSPTHYVTFYKCEGNGATGLGPFARILPDPITDALRAKYVGKPLWTFGRFVFGCRDPNGWGATAETRDRAPLYVASIYRLADQFDRIPLGSADPFFYCEGGCHQAYHVFTDRPLIVTFAPRDADIKIDPPRMISHPWLYRGPCVAAQARFLDDWDFERVFSLEDPHTIHPEWSTISRKDILAYQFDDGMTHEMVAWAAGYPSTFGTPEELDRLSSWQWYGGQSSYFNGDAVFGGGWAWGP